MISTLGERWFIQLTIVDCIIAGKSMQESEQLVTSPVKGRERTNTCMYTCSIHCLYSYTVQGRAYEVMLLTTGWVFPHQLVFVMKTVTHRNAHKPTWGRKSLTETLLGGSRVRKFTTKTKHHREKQGGLWETYYFCFLAPYNYQWMYWFLWSSTHSKL